MFLEEMANMAKEAMVEGLGAVLPDGEQADHQTRLQYFDRMMKMNCWSASDRMQIRNHIRQVTKDRMKHNIELKRADHDGSVSYTLPAASLKELR